jgi:hypothetical protein
VVTLGLLHALKGGGNRAFSRWLTLPVGHKYAFMENHGA